MSLGNFGLEESSPYDINIYSINNNKKDTLNSSRNSVNNEDPKKAGASAINDCGST